MATIGRTIPALAVTLLLACRADPFVPDGVCEPADQHDVRSVNLGHITGTFAVTFVATGGPRSGESAPGRLEFRPQLPGLMHVPQSDTTIDLTQPAIGRLDLALEEIGATRVGDPMSGSDTMPGVGLYVVRRAGELVSVFARVGSGSNVRGPAPLDGAWFTLFVRQADEGGFAGSWRSSKGMVGLVEPDAVGYFCAARLAG